MIDETELRNRFAQLREAERVGAPGFAQTYGRARARETWGATQRVRPFVIAAAAIAIVAFSLARSRSFSPSAAPAIATWRAPTDVLLRTPGSELLGTMPALRKSVLDKMIPTPSNRGT